jgi:hypothetical protein
MSRHRQKEMVTDKLSKRYRPNSKLFIRPIGYRILAHTARMTPRSATMRDVTATVRPWVLWLTSLQKNNVFRQLSV